jgi:hypothetical protein
VTAAVSTPRRSPETLRVSLVLGRVVTAHDCFQDALNSDFPGNLLGAARNHLYNCQDEIKSLLGDAYIPSDPKLGRSPEDIDADLYNARVRLAVAVRGVERGGDCRAQLQEAHDLLEDLRDDLLTLRGDPARLEVV